MKRIGLLLISFLLFLAACGSNETTLLDQEGGEVPGSSPPTATPVEPTEPVSGQQTAVATSTGPVDDPTAARDRDWKLGDIVDPAVTIIEYGDFQ